MRDMVARFFMSITLQFIQVLPMISYIRISEINRRIITNHWNPSLTGAYSNLRLSVYSMAGYTKTHRWHHPSTHTVHQRVSDQHSWNFTATHWYVHFSSMLHQCIHDEDTKYNIVYMFYNSFILKHALHLWSSSNIRIVFLKSPRFFLLYLYKGSVTITTP